MALPDPLVDAGRLSALGYQGRLNDAVNAASAAVRDAARNVISQTTSTVTVPAPQGRKLDLPGPVTAVASVLVDGQSVDGYRVDVDGLWLNEGWSTPGVASSVAVTYTHGYETIPEDVADLVIQLAVGWLNHLKAGGGSTAGLQSVKIDDASETYSPEAAGQVSPAIFIPKVKRDELRRRFAGAGAATYGYER